MLTGGAVVLEPKQFVFINVPQDFMGQATKEIQQRRGQVQDIRQEDGTIMVESKTPVAELFGFSGAIRSATEGRALWTTEFAGFERMPPDLQQGVVSAIRGRKGLKPQPPKVSDFIS
jgi:elongation factor 2